MVENENIIKNRSEILFLYDIKDANPNGDPLDDNKPRMDEETEINLVTDVRLKRTIRDYLMAHNGEDIFIKDVFDEENHLYTAKRRAIDYAPLKDKDAKKIDYDSISDFRKSFKNELLKCADIRLFGATIPTDKIKFSIKNNANKYKEKDNDVGPITFIGPVQFRTGRSLHKVDLSFIKGTGAFASNETSSQKTFREEYVLPYSLIAFYGVVNENAAKDTGLSEDDLHLLFEGIWYGTKNLISRSKFGQMPRFLLQIEYNEKDYFIGDLNHKISLNGIKNEKSLRDISECPLNVEKLLDLIYKNRDKISKICFKVDDGVVFNELDNKTSFKELLENKLKEFTLSDISPKENSFDWDYCLSIEKKEE